MSVKDLTEEVAAYPHGRVPRELRRRQVLTEARELFIERGYEAASMDELARRMRVSKPVVYDLAGSKQQLFRDVIAMLGGELAVRLATAVGAEPDLTLKLRAGILASLHFIQEHRAGWTALLSMNAWPMSAEVADMRREQVLLVARVIAERQGAGGTPAEPRIAEIIAQAINGAVESVALWWKDHPDLSAESLADLLTRFLSPGLLALSEQRPLS